MALHAVEENSRLTDKSRLLRGLHRDREQREDRPVAWRRGRLAGLVLLLGLAGAATAFFMQRAERFEVETALAVAPSAGAGPAAILQAAGIEAEEALA